MNEKWLGRFGRIKMSSWLSAQRWLWLFLNMWCLFDLFMFPLLFALFYTKHLTNKNRLKNRGRRLFPEVISLCFYTRGLHPWGVVLCCILLYLHSSALLHGTEMFARETKLRTSCLQQVLVSIVWSLLELRSKETDTSCIKNVRRQIQWEKCLLKGGNDYKNFRLSSSYYTFQLGPGD